MKFLLITLTILVIIGKLKLSYDNWRKNSGFAQYLLPEFIRSFLFRPSSDNWLEISVVLIGSILFVMLKNYLVLQVAPLRRFFIQNNLII